MSYTLSTSIKQPIDIAIETLKEICMNHKLGIVSEVDVQATIKNKLSEEIAPYKILGACNPGMAKQVITASPKAGALLPCTIAVREVEGETFFDFMAPETVLTLDTNPEVQAVAAEATKHLKAVIADLEAL